MLKRLCLSLLVALSLAFATPPSLAAPTRAEALSQVAGTLLPTTQETAAGLVTGTTVGTICNLGYLPGNVLRYCADPTGATDSTPAWTSALAQRLQHGEAIVFPAGLYKGNFVVTGQYVDIRFEHFAYEDAGTVYGFIANNTSNPIWQFGDGSTPTTSVRVTGGLQIHGQATATKCTLISGVANLWIDGLVSRGCTSYGLSYTASTTRPSSYVFINDYRIDIPSGFSSAVGLLVTQPANYPTSYATALFLSNGALIGQTTAGSWGAQINANSAIWVSNSYWTMGNGAGIDFSDTAGTGIIYANGLFVDTLGTSSDTLVTIAATAGQPINANLIGNYGVNGKVSVNGTSSASALGGPTYLGYRSMFYDGSVVGYLDFQDSALGWQDQTQRAQAPIYLSRTGTNLFINNTSGAILARGSRLQLQNAAGNGDGILYFSTSAQTILTGSGAPAVAAPVGSLYLRTDGGATTTLYVKESGTGTSGWVAK